MSPDRTQIKLCEMPGCEEVAGHRAPRTPNDLRSYRWFCLDHVKEYNRAWNFFEGWSQDEIERFQREDLTGHRPTWRLGKDPGSDPAEGLESVFREFKREWFAEEGGTRQNGAGCDHGRRAFSDERREALAVLDLHPPCTRDELRRRYKALVKRHHPDANGGSRESEELLKQINRAYNDLIKELS